MVKPWKTIGNVEATALTSAHAPDCSATRRTFKQKRRLTRPMARCTTSVSSRSVTTASFSTLQRVIFSYLQGASTTQLGMRNTPALVGKRGMRLHHHARQRVITPQHRCVSAPDTQFCVRVRLTVQTANFLHMYNHPQDDCSAIPMARCACPEEKPVWDRLLGCTTQEICDEVYGEPVEDLDDIYKPVRQAEPFPYNWDGS